MSISRNRTILLRLIFPSICGSLGTWQIFRWKRKQQLLKELDEKINSEPFEIKSLDEVTLDKLSAKFKFAVKSTGEQALLGPRGLGGASGYGYTLFEKAQLPNG